MIEQLWREFRHAGRALRRSPGATALSVATMTIGIGASAALFALVDAIVLRPLPYPYPDQLVRVYDTNQRSGVDRSGITTGNLFEWRQRTRAFTGIAGYFAMGRTLGSATEAHSVIAAQVTEDFFQVTGIGAALGRTFTAEEASRATYSSAMMPTGTDPVVILSHETWQSQFGGDRSIVGKTAMVERLPFTIVGVMPAGFAFPSAETQVWLPWQITARNPRDQHYLGGVARVRGETSVAEAENDLRRVAADLAREYPGTNADWSVRLVPLHTDTVGVIANVLWLLLGAVALVLLVAAANVALMTVTRGLDRSGETAVRLAVGATSARLMRESLMESAIQASLSGLLGAAVAGGLVRLLPAIAPDLQRSGEVTVSPVVLSFVVAVTALTAALSGLPQAWRSARIQPASALSLASVRTTGGASHASLRYAMTVAQVALSVVLLTGAGLLVRSVQQLIAADAGFDPHGVVVAPVFLDTQGYKNPDQVRTYYRSLFERLSALPVVISVGGATTVPTSPLGPDFARPVWRQDAAMPSADQVPASVRIVSAGYIETMGMRLKSGRGIDDRDRAGSPLVVMVSETLARQLWPNEDAAGKQLVIDYSTAGTYPYEVVGVVGDVRFRGPRSLPDREVYLAHAQRPYLIQNVVVKASGNPRNLVPDVLRVMREIDPQKPPQSVDALEDLLGDTYARDRLTMTTLVLFAAVATLLAMLSVYGVLSRLVRERVREIAIRMAMGADAGALLRWVSGLGARLVVAGVITGLIATRLGAGVMTGVLYGIAPTDLLTTVSVVLAVLVVGGIATVLPWRSATRIDPVEILRRG